MQRRAVDILIVESDRVLADIYGEILRRTGKSIRLLQDPDRTIAEAKKIQPRLIFFDLFVPRANGFLILESLSNDPSLGRIPVVVCTRFGKRAEVEEAMRLGADAYIIQSHSSSRDIVETVKGFLE